MMTVPEKTRELLRHNAFLHFVCSTKRVAVNGVNSNAFSAGTDQGKGKKRSTV